MHKFLNMKRADDIKCCRASPEVAAYPFTTLTPNLGVIQNQDKYERDEDGNELFETDIRQQQRATLADLPGLIQGAHTVSNFQFMTSTSITFVLSITLLYITTPVLKESQQAERIWPSTSEISTHVLILMQLRSRYFVKLWSCNVVDMEIWGNVKMIKRYCWSLLYLVFHHYSQVSRKSCKAEHLNDWILSMFSISSAVHTIKACKAYLQVWLWPLGIVFQGKGLGRMFLRHLRRTNALLHVVDASSGRRSALVKYDC